MRELLCSSTTPHKKIRACGSAQDGDLCRGGIILYMLPDLQLNDHLRLKKPHPCGSYEWTVIRLGADIGLECKGCQHRVMLTRRELVKRMKANLTIREENKEEAK